MDNRFDDFLAPKRSSDGEDQSGSGSNREGTSEPRNSGRVLYHNNAERESLTGGELPRSRAELAGIYTAGGDRDPLALTMTPTTNFLEQPMMLGLRKDFKSQMPDAASNSHATGSVVQDDLLIDLDYKTPSLWQVAVAGVIGFVVGGVLNKYPVSSQAQYWMGMLGYFLVLAFSCITLPMVFTSVTICISNMVVATKTKSVLVRLGIFFVAATFLGCVVALVIGLCLANAFEASPTLPLESPNFDFKLQCPNGKYYSSTSGLCDVEESKDAMILTATNVTGITLVSSNGIDEDVSFATQLVTFIKYFFPENITDAFASGQFLGVTVFSMVVGASIMTQYDPTAGQPNHALILIKQVHVVLELILNWLVPYIPLSVVSMLLFCIQTGTLSRAAVDDALFLILAMVGAIVVHFVLVVCVIYFVFVRRNPLKFFLYLTPALIYIFATGDYLMTIPVLMRSIEKSRQISRTLSQFSVCLGISLSLCGSGMFYVVAPIFMACSSGQEDLLTPGRLIGLVFMAFASSFASPPVSGLALTITCTIWKALFSSTIPGSFAYAVAMEWLTLRLRRIYNLIIIAFIAVIVAEQLDETAEDEDDRAYMEQQLGMTQHAPA